MDRRRYLASIGMILPASLGGYLGGEPKSDRDGDVGPVGPVDPNQRGYIMVISESDASRHVEVRVVRLDSEGDEDPLKFYVSTTLPPESSIRANGIEFAQGKYRIAVDSGDKTETYEWDVGEAESGGVGNVRIRVDDDDLRINILKLF